MEALYLSKHSGVDVSEAVDLENYFNEYGAKTYAVKIRQPDTMDAEVNRLGGICSVENLLPRTLKNTELPYDGFKPNFVQYDVPDCALTLTSLRALRRRSDDYNKKLNKRLLRYRAEVDLEDVEKVESDMQDLAPLQHYVLTVRVYLPGVHSKSSGISRSTCPQVSQEFLCISSDHLSNLRDRIFCSTDYQPMNGDVSEDPFVPAAVRTKDVETAAMFYLGNNFYIDTRKPENSDYSQGILEWGSANGYTLGKVFKMEETSLRDIRDLRLGYPYLYMHQRVCEHVIVITDARLLHESDCMDSTKYPIMRSFANLQGKHCVACRKTSSKYLVIDHDKRLPQKVAHFCTICLTLFNYVNRAKIGNFQVYKYVDRASII